MLKEVGKLYEMPSGPSGTSATDGNHDGDESGVVHSYQLKEYIQKKISRNPLLKKAEAIVHTSDTIELKRPNTVIHLSADEHTIMAADHHAERAGMNFNLGVFADMVIADIGRRLDEQLSLRNYRLLSLRVEVEHALKTQAGLKVEPTFHAKAAALTEKFAQRLREERGSFRTLEFTIEGITISRLSLPPGTLLCFDTECYI
jgi:hypothetical protein